MNFIHLTSASAGINACPKRRKHVKIKPETILRQKSFHIKICEKKTRNVTKTRNLCSELYSLNVWKENQ